MINKNYLKDSQKTQLFKLLNAINQAKPNSIAFSLILVVISMLNRLSTILPISYTSESFNMAERIYFDILYYSDLTNILTRVGMSISNLVIIYMAYYYGWCLFIYLFSKYYSKLLQTPTLKAFMSILGTIYEINCWILFYPTYEALFAELFNGNNFVTKLLAGLTLPGPFLMIATFNYCEFEINYMGLNYIYSKFSRIQIYMALAKIIQTSFQQITAVLDGQASMAYFNSIISLFDAYYFLLYFPICNIKLNKYYILLTVNVLFMNWPIYARLHLGANFDCSFVGIVGSLLITALGKKIYKWRKWQVLFEEDFSKLSFLMMDFASRKMLGYLNTPPGKTARASIKIVLFLKNHIRRCKDDKCPCHEIDFDELSHEKKHKLFEKTIFTLALKHPIIKLISYSFRTKLANTNRDSNVDFAINFSILLFCHTEEYMQSFSDLTGILMTRHHLRKNQIYKIKTLQNALEEFLNRSSSASHDEESNFSNVIIFSNLLDSLKKKMSESIDMYIKFYNGLKKSDIQMKDIVQNGGEIRAIQDAIREVIDRLYTLNKENNQLTRLVYLYTSLGIILEDKSKRISNLFRDFGQFIQRAKRSGNIPDVFDEECTVIFCSLADTKLGVVRKASPYIKTMFGYDLETTEVIHVAQLMPIAFGEQHDQFLREFLRKSDYKRLNKYIDVFGQTRDGFALACDLYLKLEVFGGELLVAGYLKAKNNSTHYLICNEEGLVATYSPKLHYILGVEGTTTKELVNFPIALMSPRLLLFYLFKGEQAQDMFIKIILGLLDNKNYDEENSAQNLSEEYLLMNERLYLCLPSNKELINNMLSKIRTLVSHQSLLVKKRFEVEREVISLLIEAYSSLSPNTIKLFKITSNFKKNMQRSDVVKINILEVQKLDRIDDLERKSRFLEVSREFLQNVSTYHQQYNPGQFKDPTSLFKYLYKDLLQELTPGTEPNLSRSKDHEASPDKDLDQRKSENDSVTDYVKTQKIMNVMQKKKMRTIAMLVKQGYINKELIQSMGSSHPNDVEMIQSSEEPNTNMSGMEHQDSTIPVPKISEPAARIVENLVKSLSKKNSEESEIQAKDFIRNERKNMSVVKAVSTLYHEFNSDKEEDTISNVAGERDDDELGTSEKGKKRKVVFESKENVKVYAIEGEADHVNNERQSAASSRATSAATTKLFKTLLLDDRPPSVVDSIQSYGIIPLFMILALSIILYLATKSKITNLDAYNEHADFANQLLLYYGKFDKQIESIFLTSNLMSQTSLASKLVSDSARFEKSAYEKYKSVILNSITNFRLQDISTAFTLEKYLFNVSQLDSMNQNTLYELSPGHMIVHASGIMKKVIELEFNQYSEFDASIYFLRKNLEVYSKGLTKIGQELQNSLLSELENNSFNWIFYQIMIVDISVICLIIGGFVQVYHTIIKVKDKGLSLLITIHKNVIEDKILDCLAVQKSIQNDNMDLDTAYKSVHQISKRDKSIYRAGKNISHISNEFIIFFSISLLISGAMFGYFIGCMHVSINSFNNFIPFLKEYNTVSNLRSFIAVDYAIFYQSLNLWNQTFVGISDFEAKFKSYRSDGLNSVSNLLNSMANLENFIENNDYAGTLYTETLLGLKYNDVCSFMSNTSDIDPCSNSLQKISKMGLTPTISKVVSLISTYYQNQIDFSFSEAATLKVLQESNLLELDAFLDYLEQILENYMKVIKYNLNEQFDNLDHKLRAFTIVGCLIEGIVLIIAWKLFFLKLKKDILVVKRTFSVLPLDLILANNFIKKFLKENSQSA